MPASRAVSEKVLPGPSFFQIILRPMNLYQHLSRVMTKGRDFVPQIDGLRFVAIIAVLAFHVRAITAWHFGVTLESPTGANGPVNWIFGAGCDGVELFFAISGFILALPFARQHLGMGEPVRLKAYYLRRLTRLEPPYVIQLVFVFVVTCLFLRHQPTHPELFHQPDWLAHTLRHLGVSLFYGSNFVYHDYPQPNIVLWSLEIEVQFYLLAPLLARLFCIRSAPARRVIIMALMLAPMAFGPLFTAVPWLGTTLLGKLQFFMAGFLFCDLFLAGHVKMENRSLAWDALFFGATAAVVVLKHWSLEYPFLPWLAVVACIGAFRGKVSSWLLSQPLITTIGGMCYTIYMYHWLMISGLIRVTVKTATHIFWLDMLIQFVLMSAIIVAICGVLFALFERPFMKRDWPRKFWAWLTGAKSFGRVQSD
jgi:peptidoglycan/LPS O-acetylase OafA/YrhL